MSLENRTAVITGAAGELGSVLARMLASQKANLALLGRNLDHLEDLKTALALSPERVFIQAVDLLDQGATHSVAQDIAAKYSRIDILLHIVGGWTGGKTLIEVQPADLELMINQHIWTSFNVSQAFVPYMVQNGWGRIVMISSPSAGRPAAKSGPYAIGKAGQEALLLALSEELKDSGVTANLLIVKTIDEKREKVSSPTLQNASWTTPEEISAAIFYLLSNEAGVTNGAKMPLFKRYN